MTILLLAVSFVLPTRTALTQSALPLYQSYDLGVRALLAFDQPGQKMLDRLSSGSDHDWTKTLSIFAPPRPRATDP